MGSCLEGKEAEEVLALIYLSFYFGPTPKKELAGHILGEI